MNQDLFCSIYANTDTPRDVMAQLVAEMTGGVVVHRGVNCAWARITFDDDYGDFEIRQKTQMTSSAGEPSSRLCRPMTRIAAKSCKA